MLDFKVYLVAYSFYYIFLLPLNIKMDNTDSKYLERIAGEFEIFSNLIENRDALIAWRIQEDKKAQQDLMDRFLAEPSAKEVYQILLDRNNQGDWNPDPSELGRGCTYIYAPNAKGASLTIQHPFTGSTFMVPFEVTY